MALTPEIRAPQAYTITGVRQSADNLEVPQAYTIAAVKFPAEFMNAAQAYITVGYKGNYQIQATQAYVLYAVRGRFANPKLRVWTFTLDNHDFYVLRLGDEETLVYDTYSKQWSTYGSGSDNVWRANVGANWLGAGANPYEFGSNILVGDDTTGTLYLLNPLQPYDDNPVDEFLNVYFKRIAMGQIPMRGRNTVPCYVIYLTANLGEPAYSLAPMSLSTSDDSGKTFQTHDAIQIETDNFTQPLEWRSLGQITAPGRLFKLEDDGAVARIDALNLNDD